MNGLRVDFGFDNVYRSLVHVCLHNIICVQCCNVEPIRIINSASSPKYLFIRIWRRVFFFSCRYLIFLFKTVLCRFLRTRINWTWLLAAYTEGGQMCASGNVMYNIYIKKKGKIRERLCILYAQYPCIIIRHC